MKCYHEAADTIIGSVSCISHHGIYRCLLLMTSEVVDLVRSTQVPLAVAVAATSRSAAAGIT